MHVKRNAMRHVEIALTLSRTLPFHAGILLRCNVEIGNALHHWIVLSLLREHCLVVIRSRHHVQRRFPASSARTPVAALALADTIVGMSAGSAKSQANMGNALLRVADNTQLAYIVAHDPATLEIVLHVDCPAKYVACIADAQGNAVTHASPVPRAVDGPVSIASSSATYHVQFPARLSHAPSGVGSC